MHPSGVTVRGILNPQHAYFLVVGPTNMPSPEAASMLTRDT